MTVIGGIIVSPSAPDRASVGRGEEQAVATTGQAFARAAGS